MPRNSIDGNSSNSYRRMDSGGSGRSSRRGSNSSNRGPVDTSSFPTEQGAVCSLKESFGFIHCAQRPDEIFFHYSEIKGSHSDDLQMDTEVEFQVGPSEKNPKKLAAYNVRILPPGTVIWEIEPDLDRVFVGIVEKPSKADNNSNSNNNNNNNGNTNNNAKNSSSSNNNQGSTDGMVRVVLDPTAEDEEDRFGDTIRFRHEEYKPENENDSNTNRLGKGDIIKFRILIDRRTLQRYARYIELIQSERQRQEDELMKTAVQEEGIVIALNKGYGFLKSNKRHEHVYFHFSNIVDNVTLKKGQEVKFMVVTEEPKKAATSEDGQPTKKCSARKLEILPKGSVVFHHVIARGVKGIVTMCPQPPANSDRGYADDIDGTIRLMHPLVSGTDENSDTSHNISNEELLKVRDVSLQFSDAPGGVYTYQHRGQSVNGLWIQEGDVLLFDVVKEVADGSYRAAPTRHTLAVGGDIVPPATNEGDNTNTSDDDEGIIRLVSLSLIGRSEGTIHTIKPQSGYGFIHFAERPIDVHFSTYNIIPEELQADLRKQLGIKPDPVTLEANASVQFDICAHGTVASTGHRGRHGRGGATGGGGAAGQHERENVKGHRILLLPPGTVQMEKIIATNVKGTIRSADNKQLYAGFVDLSDDVQPMPEEDRHPLVVQMIEEFMEEVARPFGRDSLIYHDVLSVKEDDVVVSILKSKATGRLTFNHVPVPGLDGHPGRLCIKRAKQLNEDSGVTPRNVDALAADGNKKGAPKKKKDPKANKNLRFDKASLCEDLKTDIPPAAGDMITCDVAQSRRTGKLVIHNLKIVERAKQEAGGQESTGTSGIGVVKDVVPSRNFGFISLLDENASKREMLFFNLSEGKGTKKLNVRKGDEVKFDISVEKSGKRIATNVQIVPRGTVPSKESKNACKGFILMEPTHTSLSDTPLRKANSNMSSGNGGGRWGNVVKDDLQNKMQHPDIHEEGCILLLEDKIGMFTGKPTLRKRSKSVDSTDDSADDTRSDDSGDDNRSVDSLDGTTDDEALEIVLNSHLPYKNGGLAIHGSGSSCTTDLKSTPRRGDMVSFVKARKGKSIRDIRIVKRQAATLLRGRLESIDRSQADAPGGGKAKFIASTEKEETYDINLAEVVSCDPAILKEKESVEGILHEGKIYGICRTSDLYLESKLGTSHKERPKLNLTVKKNRGGTIMAQSMMAKGPDGTIGFSKGWTKRQSIYAGMKS